MNINDPKILSLRRKVDAARQEFDMAVVFHEAWKPAAYDDDLRRRLGVSYATNTFFVVRTALRREMLLALMRLWDKDARAVGMESIAATLRDRQIIDALASDRAAKIGLHEDEIKEALSQRANDVIVLIQKYTTGGSHEAVCKKLRRLRNERLAHRQTTAAAAPQIDPTAEEIESFYQDMSTLIRLLLSLAMGLAYNPEETGGVYRHHSAFFWAGVRGERTAGHPNYRAPPLAESP